MRYRNGVVLLAVALAGSAAERSAGAGDGLRQAFERARYALEDSGHGSYRGRNPAQRLTLEFDGREARLSHPDGSVSFHLTGYGYGERMQPPAQARLTGAGNRVEYQRGDLTEWYVNGSQGLEQGFTLAKRPGTDPRGEPLVIAMGVSGGLAPVEKAGDGAVLFGTVLRYAGLKAVDARGRVLPSRMRARGGEIRLIVEDRDAQYPLVVDPTWSQQQELKASDGVSYDYFGESVSVDGNTAVIGENTASGAAYVFVREAGAWTQQQKLTAANGVANDCFGHSVAVSGNTAVIGACSGNGQKGAAYVFVRNGVVWSQQQELTASDGAMQDYFGSSVSVSGDTAAVGAWGRNGNQGAVYIFVRSGTAWSLQQELTASDGVAYDRFGFSVSVSGDTAAIGAQGRGGLQGAGYVFVRSSGAWSQQGELVASDGAPGDFMGQSASVSGDTAVMGAPQKNGSQGAAYVFVRSGGAWSQQQKLAASDGVANDNFGISVSVGGDTAVVGAYGHNFNQGAAYVFGRSGAAWSQQQELTASDGQWLGFSVALSGRTAVIGATGNNTFQGAAYAFVTPRLGTSSLLVGSGAGASSVALSYDGAWTATSNSSFLHVSPESASGAGSGVVVFTYDAFTGWGTRAGTLTIAGLTVTVTQAGANYLGPGPVVTLVSTGLNDPMGLAVDGSGNVYIADYQNNLVKEWSASTQAVSTLVSSGLYLPHGTAVDGSGNVYIADAGREIQEWNAATEQVSPLVSQEYAPLAIAVDGFGNVYFADNTGYAIRERNAATEQVSTLVSSGLFVPLGVAVDVSGNVYIADYGNGAVREWSAATQLAMPLTSAAFLPLGVAVDGSGNVYIADADGYAIREWSAATQQVATLVASGLNYPQGVAVDGSGNVYISDSYNNAIKEIPNAFVGPPMVTEPASAGSDALLQVLPATTNLTGVFAPTSDQGWLTIGAVANGVVSFSFTANSSEAARTAHISLLGQQIPVTQSGVMGPVTLNLGVGLGLVGQSTQPPIQVGSIAPPYPAAVQVDVSFDPTKLSFTSASAGAALTSAGKSLFTNQVAGGDVRLLGAGVNQTPIPGGPVAVVTFTFNPAFTGGSTTVTLGNCAASDSEGGLLPTACTALTIAGFTCDLIGNGNINVADVQIIINEALGVIPAVHDLNHDGVVDVADVQKEINAALGLGCKY